MPQLPSSFRTPPTMQILHLKEKDSIFSPKNHQLLHIAPEYFINRFEKLRKYKYIITADIESPLAKLR
jgi:hypothetical protein